jgi:hypothetical protein
MSIVRIDWISAQIISPAAPEQGLHALIKGP